METLENQTENQAENNPLAENHSPAPINSEPINSAPVEIAPAELLSAEKPRRGRPPGSKSKKKSEPENAPIISQIPGEPSGALPPEGESPAFTAENAPAPAPVDYKAMAGFIVTMGTGTAAKLIGPEWEPDSEQEKEFLVTAVESYLQVKQSPDIPPGMMLAIVLAGYSAKRLSAPATQSFLQRTKLRLQQTALWIKSKMGRKKNFTPQIVQPAQS